MYLQIMDHIKQCVITQQWPAGYGLPSIRELAFALNVSVITVKRAYKELEQEGVIVTRHGMGSFIAEQTMVAHQQKEAELSEHLVAAVNLATLLNIPADDLKNRLAITIAKKMI